MISVIIRTYNQEETTVLSVPCLTLRENGERPVTVEIGSNQLVGTDAQRIIDGYRRARGGALSKATVPPLWDGKVAGRIVRVMMNALSS